MNTATAEPPAAALYLDRSAVLTARPVTFACADCGIQHNRLDVALPPGWCKVKHLGCTIIRCPDCLEKIERDYRDRIAAETVPATDRQPPLVVDAMGWASITDQEREKSFSWRLYNGCRVAHWQMPETGAVAIQILGGDIASTGAIDDAVLFVVRRAALRDMIDHFEELEGELAGQESRPAERLRQARRAVAAAAARMDASGDRLNRLCAEPDPEAAGFEDASEIFMADFERFARALEDATGLSATEISRRLSPHASDSPPQPLSLGACAAASAH